MVTCLRDVCIVLCMRVCVCGWVYLPVRTACHSRPSDENPKDLICTPPTSTATRYEVFELLLPVQSVVQVLIVSVSATCNFKVRFNV